MFLERNDVLHISQQEKESTWLLNWLFNNDHGYAVDLITLYPEGVEFCFNSGWLYTVVNNGSEVLTLTNCGLSALDQRFECYKDFYLVLGEDPSLQDE
jgi:hypothetical protein